MVNKRGINGYGQKIYDELRDYLLGLAKKSLTVEEKLVRLRLEHGLDIQRSKFFNLQKRLGIPSVRKPNITPEQVETAVISEVSQDGQQLKGPLAIKEILQQQGILVPRNKICDIMKCIAPEGFDRRFPGHANRNIVRKPLTSVSPFREVSADGHEKLNSQALQMGNLSISIYAYRDKWSGTILKLCAVPDARRAATIGHIFLDLVHAWGGIPVQITTDKGSEIGWQSTIQSVFREFYAPDIDMNIFPASMAIKSTRNTVIESLWKWLREKSGRNIKDLILVGKSEHRFYAQSQVHHDLFYWIFMPLIQSDLDKFTTYWNNHKIRKQIGKEMPSGHIPIDALHHPTLHNGLSCLITVPEDAQAEMRNILSQEVGDRDAHLSWYSQGFNIEALRVYQAVGSPSITFTTAWQVFTMMAHAFGH